ncbi:glycosyltransferase family 4 protein [Aurantiacibacter marinus]|nr:glycosyltransferase family 4 protein [Aurantiacibacter marinus]
MVSIGDADDRRSWSGTPYFAKQELERRFGRVALLKVPLLDKIVDRANPIARKLGFDISRWPILLAAYGRSVDRQIADIDPDIIVAVGGAWKLYGSQTKVPTIFVSDGLFVSISRYYAKFRKLRSDTVRNLVDAERAFVTRPTTHLLMMAQWCADEAQDAYALPDTHVRMAPIGANLDDPPSREVLDHAKSAPNLLWIGVDWERKGGPELLRAFALLRKNVPAAALHIVGMKPADAEGVPGVSVHGFLRKNVAEERDKLLQLFVDARLFVMLSREEAFGLVYCEAAAYGIPAIGYATGGVETIVKNGETGRLLPRSASDEAVAEAVADLLTDNETYHQMRIKSRDRFENVLNWGVWGDAIEAQISAITAKKADA